MITVIGSLKGGSGKSTTSFNIAVWLLTQDFTTAVFDLDPQQTLADAADFRAEDEHDPVLKIYSPKSKVPEKLIAADLTHTEVLVDIGNSDMNAVRKAYKVADRIVIPVLPSQSDVWSLQRFLKFIKTLDTKPNLEIVAFINRADTHHAVMETRETLAILKQLPGIKVVPKMLSQRLGFRRSFSEGMGIFELEPRSKAAAEFLFFARSLYPLRRKQAKTLAKTAKVVKKSSVKTKPKVKSKASLKAKTKAKASAKTKAKILTSTVKPKVKPKAKVSKKKPTKTKKIATPKAKKLAKLPLKKVTKKPVARTKKKKVTKK
ncbi:MAG: AAA family ATPase [Arenicellales bacterium]